MFNGYWLTKGQKDEDLRNRSGQEVAITYSARRRSGFDFQPPYPFTYIEYETTVSYPKNKRFRVCTTR